MNTMIFKKMQIVSLAFLTCASVVAIDPTDEAIGEKVKGTGQAVLQKLSEATEGLQKKGVEAAHWVNGNWNKVTNKIGEQVQKVKDSELLDQARKSLQTGYKSFKTNIEAAFKKTGATISENVDAAKSTSQSYLTSWKDWFNNKSKLSSDELVLIGGAVVAVVTICGVTYILYKNGTIKKVGETITTYPVLTTVSTATVGLLLALVYKMYTDSNNAPVVVK